MQLAVAGRNYGRESILLDPMHDARWSVAYKTHDKGEFLRAVWSSKNCNVIVDEAGDEIGRYDDVMNKLATRGRHWGHNCYFITQRPAQLSLTVRTQCDLLFCFRIDAGDAKALSQVFVEPKLLEVPTLQRYEYFYVRRFEQVEKRSLKL
jgi:Predicted ATPase